jgi:hypothetical protein
MFEFAPFIIIIVIVIVIIITDWASDTDLLIILYHS